MCPKPVLLLLLTSLSLVCLGTSTTCHASERQFERGTSAGLISSPKGVGFCMDLWYDGQTFSSFSFTADLIEILNGKSSTPGGKSVYHYNFIFASLMDGKYELYAGPGLTAGYVRNTTDNKYGLMAGISGDCGIRMKCLHSIVLSLEAQADYALIFKNRNSPNMALYKEGFTHSYFPHLRIQYSF